MSVEAFPGTTGASKKTIWEPGERKPASQRRLRNWPLEAVNMDVPLEAAELASGAHWPPPRARKRSLRLDTYERLYRGDLSDFVGDPDSARVTINYFARGPAVLSALMVSAGMEADLLDPAQTAIVDCFRYGRTYVTAEDDAVTVVDPRLAWRGVDGESLYVVAPYVSAESTDQQPDMAMVKLFTPPVVTSYVVRLESQLINGQSTGVFGEEVTDRTAATGNWSLADNPPTVGGWGTSAYDVLIPPVVGVALRYSGIEYVLANHEAPVLLLPVPKADTPNLLPEMPGVPPGSTRSFDAQKAVQGAIDSPVIWTPDGVGLNAEYLEYDGSLQASFTMIQELRRELRGLTGIAAALEQEGGDVPSGAALRQMFAVLGWTSSQLHLRVRAALSAVLGREVDWPNPFDETPVEAVPVAPEGDDGEDDGDPS